uniref:Cytochrome c biogenesis protein Ccs1 n=1 Tax=Caloglossa beccarii TaxID=131038 RepID=A0A1Z1M8H3_9FLOR|nr:cytochrome c biogenesis protein ccs1 [Caloglossa beccarii]ARW62212.1 cytochrome c biogenesis protein ccs1 [Caloglossa beccarii]
MKLHNISWIFFKKISNLNFSIFLLFSISVFIMLGSIIEQNQSVTYYQTYYQIENFFSLNWKIILFLGLDHVYQAWWFILTLLIFALSLLACTFSTQFPSLQYSRRWKFSRVTMNSINLNTKFTNKDCQYKNSSTNMLYSLINYNFYAFHKQGYLYAYKGLFGRLAPIFVHFSMILILIGSIFTILFGYTVQEIIPSGEIFHLKNIIDAGYGSKLKTNFTYKIDKFFLDYNTDNSIKQFFSVLSILDNHNKVIIKKNIFVNSPLKFNKLTFYQTDWNVNAIRVKIGFNNSLQCKLIKININNKTCWLCKLPIDINKHIYLVLFNLYDKIFISDSNGLIINSIVKKQIFYVNHIPLFLQEIVLDTGLQIKVDLGIDLIYLGFFILMLTTVASYISYSQVWIYIKDNFFNMAGSTNRAILLFEEDIVKISSCYGNYTYFNK